MIYVSIFYILSLNEYDYQTYFVRSLYWLIDLCILLFFKFLSISMMKKLIGYAWHLIQYSTSSLPFDVLCNRVWIKRMWFFQRIIATRHWHIFRSFKRNRAKLTRWRRLNLQKKKKNTSLNYTILFFSLYHSTVYSTTCLLIKFFRNITISYFSDYYS